MADVIAPVAVKDGKIEITLTKPTETPVANMETSGFLDTITNFKLMEIPVGASLVGYSVAKLTGGIINKYAPLSMTAVVGNLVGAFLLVKFGKRFIGVDAAKFGAMFLAANAANTYVDPLLNKLLAMLPGGATTSSVVNMAQRHADYYAAATGGR